MRKIEYQMLGAVRKALSNPDFCGRVWKDSNTLVYSNHYGVVGEPGYSHTIEVILHDTVIGLFEVEIGRLSLYTGGWHTRTTTSRLQAILDGFAPAWFVNLRKGQTYITKRTWSDGETELMVEGRELSFMNHS